MLGHDRANLGALLQTARALRADPRHARTPVVCISETSINEALAGACLEAGVDELIMAQIDQASLTARLKARLRRTASPTRTVARMNFARQAHDMVERARRFEKTLSVVLIEFESSASQGQDPWRAEASAARFGSALERNLTPDDLHTRWTDGAFALLLNEAMPPGAFLGQLKDSDADLPVFRAAIARFPEDSATLTGLFTAADARLADARADAPGSIVDSARFRAITATR